jgi:hypothetical protein
MIFICLTIVDFPDSPEPNRRYCQSVYAQNLKHSAIERTYKRKHDLATYQGDLIIGSAEVKLGGKVPLTVGCGLTTDFVSMKGKKCLVGRHSGRVAVEEVHGKVEDAQTREETE